MTAPSAVGEDLPDSRRSDVERGRFLACPTWWTEQDALFG